MAEERIPAWKRLGLKVKKTVSEDPLAVPTHLEDANITNKQKKSLKNSQQKRSREEPNNKSQTGETKKPAKRKKLPKSERAPPPEKDQLAYLKQYVDDQENWKFSKQKQNWLIKNVLKIDDKYMSYLHVYFKSIQGGSKIRVERELKETITKWNTYADALDLKNLESESKKENEVPESSDGKEVDEKKKNDNSKKDDKKDEVKDMPSVEEAKRAQQMYEAITEEKILLSTIDEDYEQQSESELGREEDAKSPKIPSPTIQSASNS